MFFLLALFMQQPVQVMALSLVADIMCYVVRPVLNLYCNWALNKRIKLLLDSLRRELEDIQSNHHATDNDK